MFFPSQSSISYSPDQALNWYCGILENSNSWKLNSACPTISLQSSFDVSPPLLPRNAEEIDGKGIVSMFHQFLDTSSRDLSHFIRGLFFVFRENWQFLTVPWFFAHSCASRIFYKSPQFRNNNMIKFLVSRVSRECVSGPDNNCLSSSNPHCQPDNNCSASSNPQWESKNLNGSKNHGVLSLLLLMTFGTRLIFLQFDINNHLQNLFSHLFSNRAWFSYPRSNWNERIQKDRWNLHLTQQRKQQQQSVSCMNRWLELRSPSMSRNSRYARDCDGSEIRGFIILAAWEETKIHWTGWLEGGEGTRERTAALRNPLAGSLFFSVRLYARPYFFPFSPLSVFLARSVFPRAIRRNYRQNGKTFPADPAVSIITVSAPPPSPFPPCPPTILTSR